MNREEWLDKACKHMKPWVLACADASEFEDPLLSVGWPKGHRGRGTAIGQCWDKTASGDKERAHIFIGPNLTDAKDVLATLLHEMVHASVGTRCGHRKEFRKVGLALGFVMPMTTSLAPKDGPLDKMLEIIAKDLGDYPHPGLSNRDKKKPGSRLLKVECVACGCIARMTRKWLDEVGPPTCGCGIRRVGEVFHGTQEPMREA